VKPPALGVLLRDAGGFTVVYAVAGGLTMVAAVLLAAAAVLEVLGRRDAEGAAAAGPYREAGVPSGSPPQPRGSTPFLGMAILLAAYLPFVLGFSCTTSPRALGVSATWLYSVRSTAAGAASLLAFSLLLAAALKRWTVPPVLLYGAGLLVFALGLVPIAAGGGSAAIFALGVIVTAAGGVCVDAVAVAYAAIAVRGRAAALVVAAWYLVFRMVATVSPPLAMMDGLRTPLCWISALLCAAAGAALLARGRALHRLFDAGQWTS
jgi:hypothetical protein